MNILRFVILKRLKNNAVTGNLPLFDLEICVETLNNKCHDWNVIAWKDLLKQTFLCHNLKNNVNNKSELSSFRLRRQKQLSIYSS